KIVLAAYLATYDGWSSDEVILDDDRNQAFLQHCRKLDTSVVEFDCNWTLLNLRKAGALSDAKVTRRRRDNSATYRHAAEIAARMMEDRHRCSTDRILCDPQLRQDFDQAAAAIAPKVDAYLLRKAAFGLRKARQLRPELVTRIADWGRKVTVHSLADLRADMTLVPQQPGIYIFRDQTGYLYVGEAKDLRERLATHLDESDRQSLASYLNTHGPQNNVQIEIHAFDANSKAKQVRIRRAYESELIRSRQPRFNVRP
ncbi:MAG: GIY-YIG nuclease family protein, partial [Planctomycetales bacterium]|nr:GIY-YIG nuclease family protein [Planctomycetales bacterium]